MPPINHILLKLFEAHGVEGLEQDEWAVFPEHKIRVRGEVVKATEHEARFSVQFDVRVELRSGETILESFAGIGETRDKAALDGIENFAATTLHVLLAACFDKDNDHASRETWVIGGRNSRVTVGNAGVRGTLPVEGEPLVRWMKLFQARIQERNLRPGTNWIRLYYGQLNGKQLACEVMLNNFVWEPIQSEMAAFDWPAGEDFYSLRLFLMMQIEPGAPPTPETAVAWLADIVGSREDFTEDHIYAALADAGMDERLADRAYKFTQTAWGRFVLNQLGVKCSDEYLWFNASGDVVESGRLADEPCFVTASQLAQKYAGSPGFRQLSLMSAEMSVVNKALQAGSDPKNLVMAPVILFVESPTPQGMEKVHAVIQQRLNAIKPRVPMKSNQGSKKSRPWWRFWG